MLKRKKYQISARVFRYTKFQNIGISLLSILFPIVSIAQITVSAEVDSTNMLIGDHLQLHLFANHAPNVKVDKVDISVFEKEEQIEILEEGKWDTLQQGNELVLRKDLTFTIFDSGYYWIPEIPISYLQDGVANTTATMRIPMNVGTVQLADSLQLAPIKDIIREEANWRDYLPYLIGLVLLGLAIGSYFLHQKRQAQKAAPPPPIVIRPAHEVALESLQRLKGEKLWQQGKVKDYQSRLTYIIREYLENRYEVPALESTTDEIQRSLKQVDFDSSWKDKLSNILQVADLVKFAKAEPPVDFHDRVWQEAEDFVLATKKKPVVVEEET